eukprot:5472260-Prymnesium_polylepis.1
MCIRDSLLTVRTPPVCPQLCKEVDAAYAEAADNVVYLTPLKCVRTPIMTARPLRVAWRCCCHACCTKPAVIDRLFAVIMQAILRPAGRN